LDRVYSEVAFHRAPGKAAFFGEGRSVVLLYNFLLLASLPVLGLVFTYQAIIRGKWRRGFFQRLGFFSLPPSSQKALWVHAVSVGEVHAATHLAKALKERFPCFRLVISTTTETGQEAARRRIPEADSLIYFPLDLPFSVAKVVQAVDPRLVVLMETEIWPNFLFHLRRRQIPLLIANCRISPRSYRGYRRLRPFMRRILASVSRFSVQTEDDAERLRRLGAPADRVRVTGNLKFDEALHSVLSSPSLPEAIRESLGFPPQSPLWVAGSVHPGEEEVILGAFSSLRDRHPELSLVLAPRRLNRVPEIEAMLQGRGLDYRLRSVLGPPNGRVLVLDTLGELASLYGAATVAFVGGSLVPWGGQNPLEPAARGVPVLFGSHMQNFQEAATLLKALGEGGTPAALEVAGPLQGAGGKLVKAVGRLLEDPGLARAMGEQGQKVVRAHAGALERNLELIAEFLAGEGD
jgi:3-deoxy-D-manno-octulosonic-acid transferase